MTTPQILKNIFTMGFVLLSYISFGQQQTDYINYQGLARDASNEVIANQAIQLGISLRFGSSTAAVLYSENHTITTDISGVFSLQIGNGDVTTGIYKDLEWGKLAPYASITLNGSDVGTVELQAVPYANSSGKAVNMELNDLTNVGGTPTDGQVLKWNGTFWLPDDVAGSGSLWRKNGDDIFYDEGSVKIEGNSTSERKFSVQHYSDISTPKIGVFSAVVNGTGRKEGFRAFVEQNEASADSYGFLAALSGTNPGYGIFTIGESMNYFSGNVGIGTIDSNGVKLAVEIKDNGDNSLGIRSINKYSGPTSPTGIYNEVSGTGGGDKIGYYSNIYNGIGLKTGYHSRLTNNSYLPSVGFQSYSYGTGPKIGIWTEGEDSNYFSGKVKIGKGSTDAQLDISGGQWDLNNTEGDFRIGNDTYRLKIGMSLGGGGAGRAHIRAQGGINEIALGAGSTEVLRIKEDAIVVNGEVNQPSTGSANMLPIAYGMGGKDISVPNGTNNFAVAGYINIDNSAWSYKIIINGESINYNTHIVMVSLVERRGTISYILEEGAIWVYASPNNNNKKPAQFSFVVYKQ